MNAETPSWLEGKIDQKGLDEIHFSVVQAENRTSAEIVPLIVHRSITTGHVPVVLFLGQLLILWTMLPFISSLIPDVPFILLELLAAAVAGVVTYLEKDREFFARLVTSRADEESSVMRRAELEFFEAGIKKTEAGTGVLLMVSWVEHRAVVLADQAILDRVPPETWEKLINDLIGQIRAGELAKGMCQAIESLGDLLATKFPRPADDRNELPNYVVVKE